MNKFEVIIDSREQKPYEWPDIAPVRRKLDTGDYSLSGFENVVAIERKELSDFVACCTFERERFERELERMKEYRVKIVIIEASFEEIHRGDYRSFCGPSCVEGSIISWILDYGVSFMLLGNRLLASDFVKRTLIKFYEHELQIKLDSAKYRKLFLDTT
jgi:DNA excision repair protein ERCC-4